MFVLGGSGVRPLKILAQLPYPPSPGQYTWSPLPPSCISIKIFGEPVHAPKWCFFNPVAILGLKKHHFGPWAGTGKKIIEVQDKKRKKMGIFGDFRGFLAVLALWGKVGVKVVYYSGHC